MTLLNQKTFYVFDEQTAQEFDHTRPEASKCFSALLPGGNAYLLDADLFEPSEHEDIDPGEYARGCSYALDPSLTQEQRRNQLARLIEQGYAVSPFPDFFFITPWQRDCITEVLARDICRILDGQGETSFE